MNWFLSILVGILTAILGGFAGVGLGTLNVRWYRVSGFEGGAGYFVALLALAGGLVGLLVGIVAARHVAGWPEPGFAKALGVATLGLAALAVVTCGLCRLGADVAPTIDGRDLELAVEVRSPRGFQFPAGSGDSAAHAVVYLPQGRVQPRVELTSADATLVEGRTVLEFDVPLDTSAARKFLRVFLSKDQDSLFNLPLRSHPGASDCEWSPWIEAGYEVGTTRPAPDDSFSMRYRVHLIEPEESTTPVTQAQVDARHDAEAEAVFTSLAVDAPLSDWMAFTGGATPDERQSRALAAIAQRPALVQELEALFTVEDDRLAADALRLVGRLQPVPADLGPAVERFGQDLGQRIGAGNDILPEDDPGYEWAAAISLRFSSWMVAVRALRASAGADCVPELQEILVLARMRPDSRAMRSDVVRVASYYLSEWAGVEPLPEDPPPR